MPKTPVVPSQQSDLQQNLLLAFNPNHKEGPRTDQVRGRETEAWV